MVGDDVQFGDYESRITSIDTMKNYSSFIAQALFLFVFTLGSVSFVSAQTFTVASVTVNSIAHKGDSTSFIWDEVMSFNGVDSIGSSTPIATTPSFSADLGSFNKISLSLKAPAGQQFEYTHPAPGIGDPINPIFGIQLTFNNGAEGDGTNLTSVAMKFDGVAAAINGSPIGYVKTDGSQLQLAAEFQPSASFSFTDWTIETMFSGLVGTSSINFVPTGGSVLVSTDINGSGPQNVLVLGTPIPEPSSYLLVCSLALGGFLFLRRRRSFKAAF